MPKKTYFYQDRMPNKTPEQNNRSMILFVLVFSVLFCAACIICLYYKMWQS